MIMQNGVYETVAWAGGTNSVIDGVWQHLRAGRRYLLDSLLMVRYSDKYSHRILENCDFWGFAVLWDTVSHSHLYSRTCLELWSICPENESTASMR
jgi:hypothetical protein